MTLSDYMYVFLDMPKCPAFGVIHVFYGVERSNIHNKFIVRCSNIPYYYIILQALFFTGGISK